MSGEEAESAFTWPGSGELVTRMHEQLDELVAVRDQMEQLVSVIVEISSDLDLKVTLRRIVDGAMTIRDLNRDGLTCVLEFPLRRG